MKNFYVVIAILLLSSCGNQTIRPDKQQYPGLSQAQSYYQQHDYANAAPAYMQLYNSYGHDEFAILAADSWLQMRQFAKVSQLILNIKQNNGPLMALIQTQLSINNGNYNIALRHHMRIPNNISGDLRPRYLTLKAEIDYYNQHYLAAALTWIELSALDAQVDVSNSIMNSLLQVPEEQLTTQLFKVEISELQQGWLEAAYISFSADKESRLQWQNRWNNHPAAVFFMQISKYSNIAVLLPLTGRYKNIAKSIQQGMLAALYREGGDQQQLSFFDTGSNGENFSFAWYGAIESGAEFIIGPLEKNSIQQLTQLNSSTVPVLLLNKLEDESNSSGFYQFSLSQEDEVASVASRLMAENKKRIMLLAPESESGRKLAIKFERDLTYLGGQVVSYEFYPEATHDYSREIKKALGLNESLVRSRQLQTILSIPIKSFAQIRPDIDAIFIIARPKQARLIKPQLKFFQAENVPVYSTSQLLSSTAEVELDKDLNGIKFTHSAFVIDPQSLQDELNFDVSQIDSNRKFFAFGFDAIALYPRLEWMQRMPNHKVAGMSGNLSIDVAGEIHRDLAWAQFKRGKAVLLPPLEPVNIIDDITTQKTDF
ncbi:MAG: penicillin-binding protein activator [Alcanivoracaceae bacterium]|nr:penicillin-binding protein activator [Alcanivoracaceae bacterium]